MPPRVWRGALLLAVLAAAFALRVQLVTAGGQYYWPDERRYAISRDAAQLFAAGRPSDAFAALDSADHFLFKVIGVVPALLEARYGGGSTATIPALFFAVFSVVNIWLVGRIARRLGADGVEALIASALVALSTTFFYWARHLVPYDLAMTFGLLALYVGVRATARPWSSGLCGLLAGLAFLTYAGYWTLGGAALLIHVAGAADRRQFIGRAAGGGLGLAAVVGAVVGVSTALGGGMLRGFVDFSRTVTQGSYAEGWRLPFAYLWHAEHWLLIAWIAGVAWWALRFRALRGARRAVVGLCGLLLIYGSLAVGSVLLETFVVYGRLARQLVPFFCLVTAAALADMRGVFGRRWPLAASAIGLALVFQAWWNFQRPLHQQFPAPFQQEANDRPGVIALNASHIYPTPEVVRLPARYTVLKEARHPLEFLPYQYEGFTPEQRDILRSTDIRIRLIRPAD